MTEIERVIHEPVRLKLLTILSGLESADFKFLLATLGLTRGNLSSHMDRLQKAGYVKIAKSFNGKTPRTEYEITKRGRKALAGYWLALDEIRNGEF